jgi:hypothetical protein
MIRFECEHCGRAVRVDDAHGGRQGRCPHCGQVVSIPPAGDDAIGGLVAAMDSSRSAADDTAIAGVPPPPAVGERPAEEEIVLPEDSEEGLEDTVVLPAEGAVGPGEKPASRGRGKLVHWPGQQAPALSARRTFLIVAGVVVVLVAALIALAILYSLR